MTTSPSENWSARCCVGKGSKSSSSARPSSTAPATAKQLASMAACVGLNPVITVTTAAEGVAVQSGNAAIASLTAKQYDAVVLDLMMREGSGHDVLKTVAAQRPHAKYVVVISATSAANIEAVEMDNVVAKLRKPFDIHELLAAVHQASVTECGSV